MKKIFTVFLCAALCACVAAGLVGCDSGTGERQTLYYNLDGYVYQNPNNTALSNRQPGAGGVYSIDFVVNGQPVTYTTTDAKLVDTIDFYQVLTMEVNEEGVIQKVGNPGKPISNRDTVQQVSEKELLLNSSFVYNGGQVTLPLAEDCQFYDVANGGELTQPEVMDEVLAYSNHKGEATDVFILRRTPRTKLYWRLNRKYNTREDLTTREPDESGVYTIPFAVEGERVELQCKDMAVVTAIDAPTADEAAMGLVLDENGFISQMLPAYRGLRGRQLCSFYDVTAVEEDRFSVVNKQMSGVFGQTYSISLSQDCQIYDVSDGASSVGVPTDKLQVGDRVTVFSDSMGIATHILVQVRLVDSPVYFNLMQMYDSGHTLRQPDADGYYSFQMVADGQLRTLKTKEKSIANKVDSYSSRGMGMELDGDEILRVFDVSCVTGGGTLVAGRYVFTSNAAMIVTSSNTRGSGLRSAMVHKDCKIYDATGEATAGTEIALQKGDRFFAFGNSDGQATCIFVTRRAS